MLNFEGILFETNKEINELKAKLNDYHEIVAEMIGGAEDIEPYDVCVGRLDYELLTDHFDKSPAQCLKQHDIALLNKLRDKFINSNHSCEHELLDMINSLELDND